MTMTETGNGHGSKSEHAGQLFRPSVAQIAIETLRTIGDDVQKGITALTQLSDPKGPPNFPEPLERRARTATHAVDTFASVSDMIQRRLTSDAELQARVNTLVSNAVSTHLQQRPAYSTFRSIDGTLGPGAGHIGGSTSAGTATVPSVQFPPMPVHNFWWGFNVYIPEEGVRILLAGLGLTGVGAGLAGGVVGVASVEQGILAALAISGASGPLAIFFAAIAAYLIAEVTLIQAVDKGNGVYVSMTWVAPGIFVPTTA